ncbi:unnamed protein product [Amoebophrya sp. A120]|nr:unnamed protein product [Amoebophrya sp. A120]|eukprot:GSA120T00003055001.1
MITNRNSNQSSLFRICIFRTKFRLRTKIDMVERCVATRGRAARQELESQQHVASNHLPPNAEVQDEVARLQSRIAHLKSARKEVQKKVQFSSSEQRKSVSPAAGTRQPGVRNILKKSTAPNKVLATSPTKPRNQGGRAGDSSEVTKKDATTARATTVRDLQQSNKVVLEPISSPGTGAVQGQQGLLAKKPATSSSSTNLVIGARLAPATTASAAKESGDHPAPSASKGTVAAATPSGAASIETKTAQPGIQDKTEKKENDIEPKPTSSPVPGDRTDESDEEEMENGGATAQRADPTEAEESEDEDDLRKRIYGDDLEEDGEDENDGLSDADSEQSAPPNNDGKDLHKGTAVSKACASQTLTAAEALEKQRAVTEFREKIIADTAAKKKERREADKKDEPGGASSSLALVAPGSRGGQEDTNTRSLFFGGAGATPTATAREKSKAFASLTSSATSSSSSSSAAAAAAKTLKLLPDDETQEQSVLLDQHSPRTRLRPQTAPGSVGQCLSRQTVAGFIDAVAAARKADRESRTVEAIVLYEEAIHAVEALRAVPELRLGAVGKSCLERAEECAERLQELQSSVRNGGSDAKTGEPKLVPLNYVPESRRPGTAGGPGGVITRISAAEAQRRGVKPPSTQKLGAKCPLDVRIRKIN